MFRIVLRPVMMILLMMILMLGASMAYGQTQEPPEFLRRVDALACHVQSCAETIPPDDALAALLAQMALGGGSIHEGGFDIYYFHTRDDKRLVVYFGATGEGGLAALGDVVAFAGAPCMLIFTSNATYIQYSTFYAGIDVVYEPQKSASLRQFIAPWTRVESLYIHEKPVACGKPLTFPDNFNIFSRWRGFQTLRFYITNRAVGV